jgi:hypothetical protein|eukprot:4673733-Prymnesium_polylepis.1
MADQGPVDPGADVATKTAPPHSNENAPAEETQDNMNAQQVEQHLTGKPEAGVRRPRDQERRCAGHSTTQTSDARDVRAGGRTK